MTSSPGLPFTHDQFLDVFATYHRHVWPYAAALWLGTLATLAFWVRSRYTANRPLFAMLTVLWAWSALAYFVAFFRTINPAATLFAFLFLLQAFLFIWRTLRPTGVGFLPGRSARWWVAVALVIYAMLYPLAGLAFGLSYPRMPTFGVPCPTVILTAGLLLLISPRAPRLLTIIPLIWCGVGGSAALLLGMTADYALLLSGVLLVIGQIFPARLQRAS